MTRPPKGRNTAQNSGDSEDGWIDGLLDELARVPVRDAPDALMARVLADATAALPAPGGAGARAPFWRQAVAALGGWGSVGGLVAATAAGFVVGFGGMDAVGIDALWLPDYDAYDAALGAVDAFGWDMEEG